MLASIVLQVGAKVFVRLTLSVQLKYLKLIK